MNFWYLPRSLRSATSSALTGPLPSPAEISDLAGDLHLHHRHRDSDPLADGVVALLDIDVELLDIEIIRHLAEDAPRQQFERGVGALIGVAERLTLLHLVEQASDARIVLVDVMPMRSSSDSRLERPP